MFLQYLLSASPIRLGARAAAQEVRAAAEIVPWFHVVLHVVDGVTWRWRTGVQWRRANSARRRPLESSQNLARMYCECCDLGILVRYSLKKGLFWRSHEKKDYHKEARAVRAQFNFRERLCAKGKEENAPFPAKGCEEWRVFICWRGKLELEVNNGIVPIRPSSCYEWLFSSSQISFTPFSSCWVGTVQGFSLLKFFGGSGNDNDLQLPEMLKG